MRAAHRIAGWSKAPISTVGPEPAKAPGWHTRTEFPIPALDVHAVDRYSWLAPMLGLGDGPPDFRFPLSPEAEICANALVQRHGLGGKPLAGTRIRYALGDEALARRGICRGCHSPDATGRAAVLAGSAAERGRCQAVAALCPGVTDLSGQTRLSDLAALIRRAEVCVTNDSGSMHLTVAPGRPVVSVFGPTHPVWIGRMAGRTRSSMRACPGRRRVTCVGSKPVRMAMPV